MGAPSDSPPCSYVLLACGVEPSCCFTGSQVHPCREGVPPHLTQPREPASATIPPCREHAGSRGDCGGLRAWRSPQATHPRPRQSQDGVGTLHLGDQRWAPSAYVDPRGHGQMSRPGPSPRETGRASQPGCPEGTHRASLGSGRQVERQGGILPALGRPCLLFRWPWSSGTHVLYGQL